MSQCAVVGADLDGVRIATDCLLAGGVVALPGATHYSIVVDAGRRSAVERVYDIKRRPRSKPLTLLVAPHDVDRTVIVPDALRSVLSLMGLPLAIIATAQVEFPSDVRNQLNPADTSLGIFWLDHFVHRHLYASADCRIAGTSLNRSGDAAIHRFDDAVAAFGGEVDVVVDGGDAPILGTSTVVDLTTCNLRVIRHGVVDPWPTLGLSGAVAQ